MTATEIKRRLNEHAEGFARSLFPAGKKIGGDWRVGSLAGDKGASLAVRICGANVGVWSDFATGESGANLVELFRQARRCDFREALLACAEWLGESLVAHSCTRCTDIEPKQTYSGDVYSLSNNEYRRVMRMVAALRDRPDRCNHIAQARGWKPETVRALALERHLGWENGKVAFIYDSGVKLRWRQGGERIIRWAFGRPWVWRGALLRGSSTAYICEGESDAISLIDAGAEKIRRAIVVALPSATTFHSQWAKLFVEKNVILCLDGDAAGAEATTRIAAALQGHARDLRRLDWEGLQRNVS